MKKTGFTLAELVITLTIIGISAALVLPQIMNLAPDKYKVRVLNIYSDLSAATENLLNVNKGYYIEKDVKGGPEVDGEEYPDGIPDCTGLECTDAVEGCSGDTKYACLLAKELGATASGGNITLSDGLKLVIEKKTDYHVITVDTGFGDGCFYLDGCKNPDKFKIKVTNDGGFAPADPLLEAYLLNPTNMHSKKEDFAKADSFKNKNYGI